MGLADLYRSLPRPLRLSEHALSENGAVIADYVQRAAVLSGHLVRDRGWWPQVRNQLNGLPIRFDPGLDRRELALMTTTVTVQSIHRIWSRRKIVHAVHPRMVDILTDSTADKMPGELFAKQPYSDPLVVFPQPLSAETPQGTQGRLLGFYVVGQRMVGPNRAVCSTHDEDRSDLMLNFLIEVPDPLEGSELVSTRVRLPVGQGMFTIDDVLDGTLEHYFADEGVLAKPATVRAALSKLVRIALGILLYTCTKAPDIVKVPQKRKKSTGKRSGKDEAPKPASLVNVGWVLGPAIEAARRAHERGYVPAHDGPGRRQPWNVRRAHMRLFWVGRGRQEPELKFIAPYEVSVDMLPEGVRPMRVHTVGAKNSTRRR